DGGDDGIAVERDLEVDGPGAGLGVRRRAGRLDQFDRGPARVRTRDERARVVGYEDHRVGVDIVLRAEDVETVRVLAALRVVARGGHLLPGRVRGGFARGRRGRHIVYRDVN